jgi:3-hydroxyisobutyrate dehydrogenase
VPNVGFLGLGVMGGPMAGHLLRAGFPLAVWNRTIEKANGIGRAGARIAESPEHLGALCDVVMVCVNSSDDVRECVGRLVRDARPGLLVVDHSTIEPGVAKDLSAELDRLEMAFLDAPVTGGSMGAQAGTLTCFVGGRIEAFDRATPYLDAYCRRAELVGGTGSGQTLKLANQIAVAGSLLGLCEALAFADRAGIDLALARELLATGAAGSWAFDNYGPKIVARDWSPGFSVKNQRKDLDYALRTAAEIGADVPGSALVDRLLARLEEEGRGEEATAALFDVLARKGVRA